MLTCIAFLGCNSAEEIGVIEGTVTLKGQPITNATLFFRDHDRGIHIMADLDEQGGYQVFTAGGKGLPLGKYRVSLVPAGPTLDINDQTGEITSIRPTKSQGPQIPKRYQDVKTSGLVATVTSGRNEFNIQLESDG